MYYRARYYHPRLQRFISEDPIGFRGGINFFRYVANNPSKWTDPTGLGPIGFYVCAALNVGKQLNDIRRYFELLDENTRMTEELLIRVQSEIAACSSKDSERLATLENIRDQLNLRLLRLTSTYGADASMVGLYQVAEALIWEGVCGLVFLHPSP